MGQIIEYNGRYCVLYRGGYDMENHKGLDPYDRKREPYNIDLHTSWNETVARGCLLHFNHKVDVEVNKEKICDFLGIEPNTTYDCFVPVNLKVCFDCFENVYLYKNTDPDPVRDTKTVKTHTKHYKEVTGDKYGLHPLPVTYSYWKFKKGVKYLKFGIDLRYLFHLLPNEYDKLKIKDWYEPTEYKYVLTQLWKLDPIDLNDSWDYEDADKVRAKIAELKRVKEAFIQKQREILEKLKNTPGYCSNCGAPNADYVDDPYDYEMYGNHNKRWLCPDCYHDIAMDV